MNRLLLVFLTFFLSTAITVATAANFAPPNIIQYNQHIPVNYPGPGDLADAYGEELGDEYYAEPVMVEAPREVPSFSAISVSDDLEVIVTSGKRQSVTLIGDSRAVEEISTEVTEKTLHIERAFIKQSSEPFDPRVLIKITTNRSISGLYAYENSLITANNIQSDGLTLMMEDDAHIRVNAKSVVLRQAENHSTRNLVISGINSRDLHLKGTGDGEFILSGIVNNLTAHLLDASCLRAEKLSIRDAYIHTEDEALAMVTPSNALYAFAFGDSNIYYSRTPPKLVQNTEHSGNVLKVD